MEGTADDFRVQEKVSVPRLKWRREFVYKETDAAWFFFYYKGNDLLNEVVCLSALSVHHEWFSMV